MIRKRTTRTTAERKQRLFCILYACVLLGAAWSTVMLKWQYDGAPVEWTHFLGMFFHAKKALPVLWIEGIRGGGLFLLGFFLLGFSAVGQPFAWLLLLTYGVCMGGALQVQCSAANALLQGLLLLCYFVPLSALLVLAAREALRFSQKLAAYAFRNDPAEQMEHQFRMYCARFVVLLLLLVLLAVLYGTVFHAIVS